MGDAYFVSVSGHLSSDVKYFGVPEPLKGKCQEFDLIRSWPP